MRRRTLGRYLLRSSLGLLWVVLLLGHVLAFYHIEALTRLDTWSYDQRLKLTATPDPEPVVVIVDIDESSLQQVARWPWPRHILAAMLDELFERQQAALVVFDVVFAEKDESSGLPVLEALAERELSEQPAFIAALEMLRPELDRDALFAEAMQGRPVLLGYYFNAEQGAIRSGQLPGPTFLREELEGLNISFVQADGFGANIPELQRNALGAGHFTPLFDVDGLSRRVPMLIQFEGDLYESLSLVAARHYLGGHLPQVILGDDSSEQYHAIEWLRVADRYIPVDATVSALIPYRGPQGSFPYIPATDIVQQKLPEGSLRDRIVLVGTTAPGLMDLRSTPMGNAFPGVEIHASLIEGILRDDIKQQPAFVQGMEVVGLLIFAGLLALLLPLLGPAISVLLTLLLLGVITGLSLWAWQSLFLVIPDAVLVVGVIGVFSLHILYGLFVESRTRRQISGLFGQYVPPKVVEALADNPQVASMEGENRELTVLFSDVRSFTTISENMPAPELARLMNTYLSLMTEIVHDLDGTIDKYIGDALMAFWGAPLVTPMHARDAVLAALLMQYKAAELRPVFEARGWPPLHIGIGLNTGMMTVGNMGSEFRRAYTVLGDAVNLGARLESLTKQYGAGILVSEMTVQQTADSILYRELDKVRVKGKQEAVRIYEPLGLKQDVTVGQIDTSALKPDSGLLSRAALFDEMLQHYYMKSWGEALDLIQQLEQQGEYQALVQLYRERIDYYKEMPPPLDWDGSFSFKTK
ncbi:CHASE2 domain-containing protein [Nitrincola alkalilacustris]|uniref:CHASE2 domain-containing protein n=1 Tax=Nitrincola alkalilacustris TaxID=1571224 RepID=UPI00124F4EA2|nr:adenylate/guanylate cyclase domain-containing protein [Nitrincola alkalilacustris]